MKNSILNNWRTTLLGLAISLLTTFGGQLKETGKIDVSKVNVWELLQGIGILGLGMAAKDHNVTHSIKKN
jgi:hypothetical protein